MKRLGNETVVMMDKQLCIRWEDNKDYEPVKSVLYWPIGRVQGIAFTEDLIGKEAHSIDGGAYKVRRAPYEWVTVVLKDGGRTLPIKVEEFPIPKPKTKMETRYLHGRWQKLLKSGWKDC